MVTGKLDQPDFLGLAKASTALPRWSASSASRNALAAATARAVCGAGLSSCVGAATAASGAGKTAAREAYSETPITTPAPSTARYFAPRGRLVGSVVRIGSFME